MSELRLSPRFRSYSFYGGESVVPAGITTNATVSISTDGEGQNRLEFASVAAAYTFIRFQIPGAPVGSVVNVLGSLVCEDPVSSYTYDPSDVNPVYYSTQSFNAWEGGYSTISGVAALSPEGLTFNTEYNATAIGRRLRFATLRAIVYT
jgi:hypothetical protein